MNHMDYAAKTAEYLRTFIEKEGFVLLKTEYVKEDGINYLRAYIDLTDKEREKRREASAGSEEKAKTAAEDPAADETGAEESAAEECADMPDTASGGSSEEIPDGEEETNEPGIGINDCALVSRRLSKWLDKEDFIPDEYTLEVCSRGYLN